MRSYEDGLRDGADAANTRLLVENAKLRQEVERLAQFETLLADAFGRAATPGDYRARLQPFLMAGKGA